MGGGYDMSIAYGAADARRTPGFSSQILPCYTTRPGVPFKEAFAGMPPLDGVLACSACCCRLYRLKPLKPIDGGMEAPGPKHDPLPQLLPLPLLPARIHV